MAVNMATFILRVHHDGAEVLAFGGVDAPPWIQRAKPTSHAAGAASLMAKDT